MEDIRNVYPSKVDHHHHNRHQKWRHTSTDNINNHEPLTESTQDTGHQVWMVQQTITSNKGEQSHRTFQKEEFHIAISVGKGERALFNPNQAIRPFLVSLGRPSAVVTPFEHDKGKTKRFYVQFELCQMYT